MSLVSQLFKKVGDALGYRPNQILTTDENSDLKLVDCQFIDYHSGVEKVLDGEVYEIKPRKQMRVKGRLRIDSGGRIIVKSTGRLVSET